VKKEQNEGIHLARNQKKGGEKIMRKRLSPLVMVVITVFAVSATAGAQAYSPSERHNGWFMLQVGCTSGTFLGVPQGNPVTATVYDVTFSGTGTVSWMER